MGTTNGYWLNGRRNGVRIAVGAIFFLSLRLPDRFWGPMNLLSNGVKGKSYPCNRPWRPIGLLDAEDPTFSK
jgi:hypothetical protein